MKTKNPAGTFIARRKYYGGRPGVSPVFTSTFLEGSVDWSATPHLFLLKTTKKNDYDQSTEECGEIGQGT